MALNETLESGVNYTLQFYVSKADISSDAFITMGAYFGAGSGLNLDGYFVIASPQVENSITLLSDTVHWMPVSGSFTAEGNESYLTIGNFKRDTSCGLEESNSNGNGGSYYLIDDVILFPTDVTGIIKQSGKAQQLYPNPAKDFVFVNNPFAGDKKAELIIRDIFGNVKLKSEIGNTELKLDIQTFGNGVYFIEINDGGKKVVKKFLKG